MPLEPIHRTVFQVEVFSRGPFSSYGGDDDPFDLVAINCAISDGDCIGDVEVISYEIVAPEKVEAELLRIGNDGSFFSQEDEDEWPPHPPRNLNLTEGDA